MLEALVGETGQARAQTPSHDLLRQPTVSVTEIAFSYAGDLWVAARTGGDARRLTTGPGRETRPYFSPDGQWIAFTGDYDGNIDAYVVASGGGVPRRVTYHPSNDFVVGWTPDGRNLLVCTERYSYADFARMLKVPVDGETGVPEQIPLPMVQDGSLSADGSRIAYVPNLKWQSAWKGYRGGQTTPILIASLADSSVERVPRSNSNDFNPMWVDNTVYFLSDRDGPVSLYAYDVASKAVRAVVKNTGLDLKNAAAGAGAIVYEQFGAIHLVDTASGTDKRVDIRVSGDLPEVRAGFRKVPATSIQNAHISPTGARAVFEARGEILTVPAQKGDARDLTNTTGAAERDPAWSPDGQRIAWFSDASGDYALHISDQTGAGAAKVITLGTKPSYFYGPRWSPDSTKIAFIDKHMTLWYVAVDQSGAGGAPVRVDADRFETPFIANDASWSPDGKWLAYTKYLPSALRAVFVHSLDRKLSYQVTDGLSDARSPVFDAGGKYLFFTASTNVGPASSWLDMSGINRPVTRSVYIAVLAKDTPSPLAFESDEEKPAEKPATAAPAPGTPAAAAPAPGAPAGSAQAPVAPAPVPPVTIDVENIGQRVLALPIPAKNYADLAAGKAGTLFLLEGSLVPGEDGPGPLSISVFDLAKRKVEAFAEGVTSFDVSANGEKALLRQGESWSIGPTAAPFKAGEGGALKLADVEVFVDPRAEWRQMYNEVWRIQRDFFYDPSKRGQTPV